MRFTRYFLATLLLAAVPVLSGAQKPKYDGKIHYSRNAGKGTPAFLSHHKDNSAVVLNQKRQTGATADLNRIEQQSLHSSVSRSGSKSAHVRAAGAPKPLIAKTDKSVPINFSGHAPAHNLTTTNAKSGSRASAPAAPKPH